MSTQTRKSIRYKDFSKRRRTLFLEALSHGKTIGAACEAAGVSRYIAAKAKSCDDDFALEWQDAIERGTERLEDELYEKALKADTVLFNAEIILPPDNCSTFFKKKLPKMPLF